MSKDSHSGNLMDDVLSICSRVYPIFLRAEASFSGWPIFMAETRSARVSKNLAMKKMMKNTSIT